MGFLAPVRVYTHLVNHRWQCYFPGVGSRPRSFHVYGDEEGVRLLGHWSWQQVLLREGRLISECPIADLFLITGGAVARSRARASSSRGA